MFVGFSYQGSCLSSPSMWIPIHSEELALEGPQCHRQEPWVLPAALSLHCTALHLPPPCGRTVSPLGWKSRLLTGVRKGHSMLCLLSSPRSQSACVSPVPGHAGQMDTRCLRPWADGVAWQWTPEGSHTQGHLVEKSHPLHFSLRCSHEVLEKAPFVLTCL